jgi:hypothetical protein
MDSSDIAESPHELNSLPFKGRQHFASRTALPAAEAGRTFRANSSKTAGSSADIQISDTSLRACVLACDGRSASEGI